MNEMQKHFTALCEYFGEDPTVDIVKIIDTFCEMLEVSFFIFLLVTFTENTTRNSTAEGIRKEGCQESNSF